MAEDDVERLVAEVESMHGPRRSVGLLRLARIVRELLAEFPLTACFHDGKPKPLLCDNCRARALRERLNRLARGEEA